MRRSARSAEPRLWWRDPGLLGALGVGLALHLALLAARISPQSGEEAVWGLMARAIQRGAEFPVLLWRAHFCGTLYLYLAQPLWALTGLSLATVRLAHMPWVLVQIMLTYWLALQWHSVTAARVAALVVACGSVFFAAHAVFPAFTVALTLGWATLALCWWASAAEARASRRWWWCGIIGGLAVWAGPMAAASILTMLSFVGWAERARWRRHLTSVIAGLLVGAVPLLLYNVAHPGATFLRLIGGRTLRMNRADWAQTPTLEYMAQHVQAALGDLLPMAATAWQSLREFLSLNRVPYVWYTVAGSVITLGVAWCVLRWLGQRASSRDPRARWLLCALLLWTVIIYLINRNPHGRYWLPSYLLIAIAVGAWWAATWQRGGVHRVTALCALATLLLWNLGSLGLLVQRRPLDYQRIGQYLLAHNVRTGYSTFQIAYPVILTTDEHVILSPTAITDISDRQPRYTELVRHAPQAAYVLPAQSPATAAMEERLRALGLRWERADVGGAVIYTELRRHVTPAELALPDAPEDEL